ncbi:hypothetical protein D3C71_2145080 [compost metagenome]
MLATAASEAVKPLHCEDVTDLEHKPLKFPSSPSACRLVQSNVRKVVVEDGWR